jgi:hypothetical protein
MADESKVDAKADADVIELVAVERGFAMGKLVEPGRKFMFRTKRADGSERKLPKWAKPADQPVATKATKRNGDLKPADAQKAVAAKAGALAGNS